MKAKIFYNKLPFAFDIIKEIIYTSDFSDRKRMYDLICMLKSRLSAAMMSSGHAVAMHRALSGISKQEMISEKMGGIDFYRLIEDIESDFDNRFDELKSNLQKTAALIFTRENLRVFDYTAEESQRDEFNAQVAAFIKAAPDVHNEICSIEFEKKKFAEGYKTSAKVQYVAKAGTYLNEELKYNGALKVLRVIMGYDYLWNQVRVVGGAYGCFSGYSRSGKVTFASYRDPNLRRTLEVFEGASSYLKDFKAGERDMTKYIIGTVSDLDFPLSPSAKGSRSREAFLCKDAFENVQRERDEILGCTGSDISALYKYVDAGRQDECICVLGGEEEIEKEKDLFTSIQPLFRQ